MKKSIATIISVAGVLGAGAAAYAVNSSVLSATSSNELVAATVPVATFAPSGSTVTPGGGVVTAGAVTTATAPTPPVVENTIPSSTRTTYKVGGAGTVVLDSAGGTIAVVGINPGSGWTARKVERDPSEIEVDFVSSTMKVEFTARLANGRISTFVESERLTTSSTRPHDDDDDDRHEDHHDDDHDDDREDD